MYCNNCGEKVDPTHKFCKFCGAKLEKVEHNQETSSQPSSSDTSGSSLKTHIKLWDKFAEIYDSSGEERKKYSDLSSNEVWELMQRISTNRFEDFIKENKNLLNKQPYKVIEAIKNVFSWCTYGGYWFWMAEAFSRGEALNKPKSIDLEKLVKEWTAISTKNYTESTKDMSDELTQAMSVFFEFEMKNILESADTVKDLPNDFIENMTSNLVILIIWGYLGGVAEAKYRK